MNKDINYPCEDNREEPCRVYPFKGINYTADEINRLLAAIDRKADISMIRDGRSAYEVAVANGYTGTEEQWLASLRGPRGEAFEFENLTPAQIEILQSPATEAGKEVKKETSDALDSLNKDKDAALQELDTRMDEAEVKTDNAIKATEDAAAQALSNSQKQWYPNVDGEGNLSWSRSSSTTPPAGTNIRGPQGNSGVSGDTSKIEVVNDLNGGESTPDKIKVLSAEMGRMLNEKIEQSEDIKKMLPVGTILMSGMGNIFGENWELYSYYKPLEFIKSVINPDAPYTSALATSNDTKYIAFNDGNIYSSEDLINWKEDGSVSYIKEDEPYRFITLAKASKDKYVAFGASLAGSEYNFGLFTSSDGLNWTQKQNPLSKELFLEKVRGCNGLAGLIDQNNGFYIADSSDDFSTWQSEQCPIDFTYDCEFITAESDTVKKFIIIENEQVATRGATKDAVWEQKPDCFDLPPGNDGVYSELAAFNPDNNTLLVVLKWKDENIDTHFNALISKDFETWEDVTNLIFPPGFDYNRSDLNSLTVCNGVFALQVESDIYYSEDGKVWSKGAAPVETGITYADDKKLMLFNKGFVYWSDAPVKTTDMPYRFIKVK